MSTDPAPSPGPLTGSARAVYRELLVHGPLSRADLARRVGLSSASLTKITRPLIVQGQLTEQPARAGLAHGRPGQPLDVVLDHTRMAGVKLTGEEAIGVLTDLRAHIVAEGRRQLGSHTVEDVVGQVAGLVDDLGAGQADTLGLGVSIAGNVRSGDDVVRTSPFLGWTAVPLADLLRDRTGLPTVVDNDVRALTAAEHWFGAGVGLESFALITVGAGVGCGLVVDDTLLSSPRGAVGAIGHLPVDDRGPLCERGHRGCARSYLSSGSIVRQIAGTLGRPELDYQACLELATGGNPVAERVLADAGRALGVLCGTVANLTGPEKIILSGEGIGMVAACTDALQTSLAATLHWTAPPVPLEVQPFAFGEWARGAAVIAIQHHLAGGLRRASRPTEGSAP